MPREAVAIDDMHDDVAAIYTEAMERAAAETVAPRGADASELVQTPVKDSPERDNSGRFQPKAVEQKEASPSGEPKTEVPAKQTDAEIKADQKPADTPAVQQFNDGPPPNWSIRSKAAWEALPADVKADVVKRESEMREGLAALRDYQDLKPYAELAKQHKTTISKALEHYTGLEQLLRVDLNAGLDRIAQNTGLNKAQLGAVFSGLAQKYGAQNVHAAMQPGAHQQPGDPLQEALKPYLTPLQEKISSYEETIRQQQDRQRSETAAGLGKAIETFSKDPANLYYSDLEQSMTKLFETGMVPLTGNHVADLKAAYELAANMNSDIREALIEKRLSETREKERKAEADKVAKAKAASKSVGGGRTPGTIVQEARANPNAKDDPFDDVRAAYTALSQR